MHSSTESVLVGSYLPKSWGVKEQESSKLCSKADWRQHDQFFFLICILYFMISSGWNIYEVSEGQQENEIKL